MNPELKLPRRGRKPWELGPPAVVQITEPSDPNFGMTFQVGDVQGEEVHGWLLIPGPDKVFVTAVKKNITTIGKGKLRSNSPCSPEWMEKYGKETYPPTEAPQTPQG